MRGFGCDAPAVRFEVAGGSRARHQTLRSTIGLTMTVVAIELARTATFAAHAATIEEARQKIEHVVIIMQENRTFDHYFGTFPGADGLPTDASGNFTTCIPLAVGDPLKGCVRPFHDTSPYQSGAPHTHDSFLADWDNGAMDGFVERQVLAEPKYCLAKPWVNPQKCSGYRIHDVMGYHTAAEIPNYWAYAQTYMLQDHLFEPVGQWSGGAHLMLTSEWSAKCSDVQNPMSCVSSPSVAASTHGKTPFAWTNLAWLLDNIGVSWRYYLAEGGTPDCGDQDETDTCDPQIQVSTIASAWNPLPGFTTFAANVAKNPAYAGHVIKVEGFYYDVANNNLPAVSWIVPNEVVSEHPDYNIVDGMNYVTGLVNTIMQSPYYENTVIFIAWDDWGGFYDHETPPIADQTEQGQPWGYGFRVPGLVISPYVAGHFDHQVLSFDAYNRFIEDLFLGSQRLDPATDGRPDSRPNVPEAITTVWTYPGNQPVAIGDLLNDFDFTQPPIPALVLSNQVPDASSLGGDRDRPR
jgi:phospholipase C